MLAAPAALEAQVRDLTLEAQLPVLADLALEAQLLDPAHLVVEAAVRVEQLLSRQSFSVAMARITP
jgi:hypothetical protein